MSTAAADRGPRSGRTVMNLLRLTMMMAALSIGFAAEAAQPVLSRISPRGAQRGTEIEITLRGERLADAQELLFDRPGVTMTRIEPKDESTVVAALRIEPDCGLGPLGVWIRTATGVTNLRTFSIGAMPELVEAEPNNDASDAQVIELNRTINGVADNEDLDVFAFSARAGDCVTAEVEGIRLGGGFFDPAVAIVDRDGFTLAACDDAALLRQDPFVSVVIPADGEYLVHVRECSYAGNGDFAYRLHVGTFPRPAAALPAGGKAGETLAATLVGDARGTRNVTMTIPTDTPRAATPGGWFPPGVASVTIADENGVAPSPVFVRISDLENVMEVEPNEAPENATPCVAPGALNGTIGKAGDVDRFRFTAKQGESYAITVFARQLRTPLDAVVVVTHVETGRTAANDDAAGPDPVLQFQALADGAYDVAVFDHLRRGGPEFVYRIELAPAPVAVVASLPRLQEQVVVPRGGRMATLVNVGRNGFGGDVDVSFEVLPEGVTVAAPRCSGTVGQALAIFEATAETPLAGSLATMSVAQPSDQGTARGGYRQDIELILGQNNIVVQAHTVDRFPVVVTEAAPYSIEATPPKAPLVQNGMMELRVRATRAEGFNGPIRLRVPFVPPGVGANNSVVIAEGQTEATIQINANPNAAVGDWPLAVVAEAGTGRGPIRTSSEMFTLRVAAPYLSFEPQAAAVEQGKSAPMYVKVNRLADFEGSFKVALAGLPHNVTAAEREVAPDAVDFQFELATQADSPAGKHNGHFCQAVVMIEGEPVVHRLPAGELRIDVPIPPKPEEAAAPPPPPPPPTEAAPVVRPLTRLEQLRKDREERRRREQEQNSGDGRPTDG